MTDTKEDRHPSSSIPHINQLSYSAALASKPPSTDKTMVSQLPLQDSGVSKHDFDQNLQFKAKGKKRRRPIRKTHSTPLYVEGIPYVPISEVKGLLAASPTRIQLRHIRNISWVNFRLVELLVDSNHSTHITNRISQHSEYTINRSFDPLSSSSFNWEANIQPESQEAALKKNFVERLAASIASSSDGTTREHIMNWAKHRNLGDRLEQQLNKKGILLARDIPSTSSAHTNLKDDILTTEPQPLPCNSFLTTDDSNSFSNTASRKRKVSISEAVSIVNYDYPEETDDIKVISRKGF
ncbi:hypothetical protein HOY82DRAFT_619847 [Tuber indicum]|nr:hypothetical protein HOY82DRAFT_619847 [Tuber indicum]